MNSSFRMRFLPIAVVLIFCLCPYARSATITAKDCSQAAVQAAVTAAGNGDTVVIPAGSATWTSPVVWTDKDISVIGAGIGHTVITVSAKSNQAFWIGVSSKPQFRISGMTILLGQGVYGIVMEAATSTSILVGWRVDHIRFHTDYSGSGGVWVQGLLAGLIDHCVFDGESLTGAEVDWGVHNVDTNQGDTACALPLNPSSDQAVFIEDCTFNMDPSVWSTVVDTWWGGRAVVRHNIINGTYVETHAAEPSGKLGVRGGEWLAVYDNVMNGEGAAGVAWPAQIRSGTGVIFDNTVYGYSSGLNNFYVDSRRTFDSVFNLAPWHMCDGTSSVDGNLGKGDQAGWPCLDQIGWYGPIGKQKNLPLYAWNNGPQPSCQDPALGAPSCAGGQGKTAGGACCDGSVKIELCNNGINSPTAPNPPGDGHPWVQDHIKTYGDSSPHPNGVVDYVNGQAMPGYTPYTYPYPWPPPAPSSAPPAPTGVRLGS